ncbi:mRNA surveillance protein pelota [Thermoplasmatales archaeon ex4484_30]|nr:MAG: mRNA surveillance protein pelota [Thermoplasmata archaeon]OYT61065.1 MAG: mRNA surveillance protein pelota [Thermoplasmatales archaeon ex4484_30]
MKVLHADMKKGEMKILIQSREDCWHLYNIIEEGDIFSAFTFRSKEKATDKIRSKKGEKEKVYLKVRVTGKEFQEFTDRLRIRGVIIEGEETGAYHTFNIDPPMEIKIEKEWKDYHLKRIEEAIRIHPKFAILAMDDEEATIAVVHEYGVEEVAHIFSHRSGKNYEEKYDEKEYYGQILKKIQERSLPLAIVGPGFEKEKFISFAKGKIDDYIVENVSHEGMTGIYEAIKRGVLEKMMEGSRTSMEIKIVEKLLEEIAKGGAVAYGEEEVRKAVEMGAVEELMILNEMVRKEEEIIKRAEEMGAKITFISSFHEGGEKLLALGGIAAFLRFKIT